MTLTTIHKLSDFNAVIVERGDKEITIKLH